MEVVLVQVQVEREDKYDVEPGWVLPDVATWLPKGATVSTTVKTLESTYFDTPDGALREFGITLRRRVGGDDSGWQLKVPAGDARTELRTPSRHKTVPRELAAAVAGFDGEGQLVPVASVTTTRTAHRVLDEAGELVVELADDEVHSTTLGDAATLRSWREIELELGPAGGPKVLAKARKVLRAAGAQPLRTGTKLHRALGVRPRTQTDPARTPRTVGDLVRAYLAEQSEVITLNDIGLRTGAPVVHKTRVAIRRTRSTLRVFADLFDPEQRAAFDTDLAWYADLLGAVRDCEVLERRLAARVAALPAEQVLGPVAVKIQEALALDRKAALERLHDGMAADRYRQLLTTVRNWRDAPPLTPAADTSAGRATGYVTKAKRKAEKRLRRANGDIEQLHRARKATKRHRYAAELTAPVDPTQTRVAHRAERRQTRLGEHQDAVVAAAFLRRLGAQAGVDTVQNGYTYGYLAALETHTAAQVQAEFRR